MFLGYTYSYDHFGIFLEIESPVMIIIYFSQNEIMNLKQKQGLSSIWLSNRWMTLSERCHFFAPFSFFYFCGVGVLCCRLGWRALLDGRHGPGRGGQLLLDVDWTTHHLHELERRRAEQLPLRERRGGALPGAVEPRREGSQVERLAVLVRNVLRVRVQPLKRRGAGHWRLIGSLVHSFCLAFRGLNKITASYHWPINTSFTSPFRISRVHKCVRETSRADFRGR